MASEKFLKAEVGQQATFGTPVTPTLLYPFTGEYVDAAEYHIAQYDSGEWVQGEQPVKTCDYVTMTFRGTSTFETLPIPLMAGFDDVAPSGTDPYTYAIAYDLAAEPEPLPCTFLLGGGADLGATGPAIKVQDAYCSKVTLSGNINSKEVSRTEEWFGLSYNDNSGAGFDYAGVAVPTAQETMLALKAALSLDDAGTTGGAFTSMTSTSGVLIDWTIEIDTGARAKWACDSGGVLAYIGVMFVEPSITFKPTIRTDTTTYGLVKAKQRAITFQELQFVISGNDTRAFTANLTGRWTECPTAHARENGEIVMKPTFAARRYPAQTTTPHIADFTIVTKYAYSAA
jgi:hypothetical protein